MSVKKSMIMGMVAFLASFDLLAQNYGENQGQNYGAHPQTGNGCQTQNEQPFRPIRNLVQGIRRLGLGKNWISMGRVPHESKQRKIGKAVAKFYANGYQINFKIKRRYN